MSECVWVNRLDLFTSILIPCIKLFHLHVRGDCLSSQLLFVIQQLFFVVAIERRGSFQMIWRKYTWNYLLGNMVDSSNIVEALVILHVQFEIWPLSKSLPADVASIRLFARVNAPVNFHVVLEAELLVANIAIKWLLARMNDHMALQLWRIGSHHWTVWTTMKRFGLMRFHMIGK